MARKKELTLIAAAKPQLRKQAKRDWSNAKAAKFLSVLGDTCNVTEACRQSGVSMTVVRRRRKMDAGFRAQWIETLADAYRRLELVLLERAFNGTEKIVPRRDGGDERMREYSDRLGLSLLKMHRDSVVEAEAAQEMSEDQVAELRAKVLRKLERLAQRENEAAAADQA